MVAVPNKFRTPTLAMLPRVSDQLSFVYLDKVRIEKDDGGIHAVFRTDSRGVERVYLPTAAIAAILLGPGTSITQPAASQALKDGSIIILSGEAGAAHHGALVHNNLTTKWLHLQASQWADKGQREEVARRLYRMRFTDGSIADGKTVEQLRGMEGHRVKNIYRSMSKRYGVPFRRTYKPGDLEASDPVNQAMTVANHILYGVTHSVICALGASPALGFIHTGSQRSFVYDISDLYKMEVTVPAAFSVHAEDNPAAAIRRRLRKDWHLLRLTRRMVTDIQAALDQDMPESSTDDTSYDPGVVHLWSPEFGPLKAGVNYSMEAP